MHVYRRALRGILIRACRHILYFENEEENRRSNWHGRWLLRQGMCGCVYMVGDGTYHKLWNAIHVL